MHYCKVCETEKPEEDFYIRKWKTKDGSPREGLENRCKACERERWAKNPPGMWRPSHYKREYGIDLEQYNDMLAEQNNRCGCCNKHVAELDRRLAVDHNHHTGEVRGLLCILCNVAIGQLGDSEEGVLMALAYLRNRKPTLKIVGTEQEKNYG